MRHQALFALVLAGCVTGTDVEGPDGLDAPDDGKSDGASDALSTELTAKYGLRPRRYNGFFNDSNEAERRFRAALPRVTAAMNQRTAARGLTFQFTSAEIATNFISEGGFFLLDGDISDSTQVLIDGFSFLGTDTIVANRAAVDPWLSEELRRLIADPAHHIDHINEKGEPVTTVFVDTIEQGLELNAAMFAWSRSLAAATIGSSFASLPPEARFFWSTVWYNTGAGFASRQVRDEGVDWWKDKWTSGDDPVQFSWFARYNALWRTSTWEYMERLKVAGG